MKKNIYLSYLFLFLFSGFTFAQVGIGTNTPATTFEVQGNPSDVTLRDGITIPKITCQELIAKHNGGAAYGVAQTGTLIYITDATASCIAAAPTTNIANIGTPGFYVFNGVEFEKVSYDSFSWTILGNAGINPLNNFMGTTDLQALAFRTNNIEKMRLFSLSNPSLGLGINDLTGVNGGASSYSGPTLFLGSAGNISANTGLDFIIDDNNNATNARFAFKTNGDGATGTVELMEINENGNVGIGTSTAPTSILALGGDDARTFQMERNSITGSAGNNLTVLAGGAFSGGTNLAGGSLNLSSGTSTGTGFSDISFQTATAGASGTGDRTPTTKMTILGSGNVGIGTTTPSQSLEVAGSIYANAENSAITIDAAGASRLGFIKKTGGEPFIASGNNVPIIFSQLSSFGQQNILGNIGNSFVERMRIHGNGNVGIGGSIPTNLLHLSGPTNFPAGNLLRYMQITNFNTGNTSTDGTIIGINAAGETQINNRETLPIVFSTTNIERMRIDPTGNVGIGTLSPTALLDVNGITRIRSLPTGDASDVFITADTDGNLRAIAASDVNTPNIYNTDDTLTGTRTVTQNDNRLLFNTGTATIQIGDDPTIFGPAYGKLQIRRAANQPENDHHLAFVRSGNRAAGMGFLKNSNTIGIIHGSNNTGLEGIFLTSDGDVGIGIANPVQKLHVAGDFRLTGGIYDSTGDVGTAGQILTSTGALVDWVSPNSIGWGLTGNSGTNPATNFIGTTDNVDFRVRTNNVVRLSVNAAGNVGIGTALPTAQLHTTGSVLFEGLAGVGTRVVTADASGNLATATLTNGTVTSVSGTAPISVANGTTTPVISLSDLGVTTLKLADNSVTSAKILDGTIANADLANMVALSVKGNATNASAVPTDIVAGTDGDVLRRSGTSLGFGTIASAGITDGTIVNADLSAVATGVGGIYKGSGSLSGATTVTQGTNTLNFTSTATTQSPFSITANSLTTGTALALSSTSSVITTGKLLSITGNNISTGTLAEIQANGLSSNGIGLNITSTTNNSNGRLLNISYTGANLGSSARLFNIEANNIAAGSGILASVSGTNLTTGAAFSVTSNAGNGLTSNGRLMRITGDSQTSGTLATFSGNGVTSGTALEVSVGSAMTAAGKAVSVTTGNITAGSGIDITTGTLGTSGKALSISSNNNAANTEGVIKVINTAASGAGIFATFNANSTSGSGITILNNGNVGIGTASPTAQLHSTGTLRFQGLGNNTINTNVLTTDANGEVTNKVLSNIVTGTSSNTATSPLSLGAGATNAVLGGTDAALTVNNTAPLWNANQLQGSNVATTAPSTDGQVLTWNGTNSNWEPRQPNALAEIYRGAPAQQTLNATFSDVFFGTDGIVDTADYTTTSTSITALKSGRYEITYRVSTDVTSNAREGGEFYLEIDGVESAGTRSYSYSRQSSEGKNTATVVKIANLNVNAQLKVKAREYSGGSDLVIMDNACSLIVKRLK